MSSNKIGVWKIVLLATSCSINANNLGANLKWLQARELRERIKEESNRNTRLTQRHGRFVSQGSVPKNILPIEEAT
jgi:hypothetical protein